MSEADDVLRSIDQLRRDLSGYHGQLKAHNDLQRHCDNQRRRIVELEGLYTKAKAENVELLEERDMYRDLVDCMVHPDVPDQLYAENVELRDENARLRSCLSDDAENARMIMGENAKLRELVRVMWRELAVACAEQVTSHETLRKVSDRMCELGIEVE